MRNRNGLDHGVVSGSLLPPRKPRARHQRSGCVIRQVRLRHGRSSAARVGNPRRAVVNNKLVGILIVRSVAFDWRDKLPPVTTAPDGEFVCLT
jgi:hypothetical protein